MAEIEVFVTHFSYERTAQCKNAAELAAFIQQNTHSKSPPQIVLADFNVHNDSLWVIDSLLRTSLNNNHPCREASPKLALGSTPLIDTWRHLNPDASEISGYTFSNMPWPGMVSRPDRILVHLP